MRLRTFVLSTATAIAASCLVHASVVSAIPRAAPTAVVVLGHPSRRNGTPHPIQRWRSRLAARTVQNHPAITVVFTGRSESDQMAAIGRDLGIPEPLIRVEDQSSNTWENVSRAIALVGDVQRVILVSDPLHAARARTYWLRQRPDDADRVFVTDACSCWDGWWLKLPTMLDAILRQIVDVVSQSHTDDSSSWRRT